MRKGTRNSSKAEKKSQTKDRLEQLEQLQQEAASSDELSPEEQAVVRLASLVVENGIVDRASDIHLDPTQEGLRFRLRVDGVLQEVCTFEKAIQDPLVGRVKIMADMDAAERRLPQDGRILMRYDGKELDLRVSTLPSMFGEKVTMRILDPSHVLLDLERLGFYPDDLEILKNQLQQPAGMIVFSGPTGCGKTTVMYSSLNFRTRPEINVMSVEDPVEYALPGVTQVRVNPRAGLTFEVALRQFLRSDPDVIMVAELRDLRSAYLCIQAALTGHLLLTALHTHDAPQALTRLIDMGVEPFLIADSVICVVSQRLVRTICPECKEPVELPKELLAMVRAESEAGGLIWPSKEPTFYHGKGCEQCRNSGYRGRTGIFQVMPLSQELAGLLVEGASLEPLREAALQGGMKTLRADGIRKAMEGITTVQEVFRVTTWG